MLQGNTYLSRLRFASLLFKPIWRRLVTVPFALLGVAAFIRDEILPSDSIAKLKLSDVLPAWPWEWFALAFLVLVLIIASESCFRMMREKDKRILLYEEAWDRTDKFLVPINEVLATLVDRLPFPAATSEDRKYELAAAKIREIGADGQMRIVGHRFNAATNMPSDHHVQIPPSYWLEYQIDIEVARHNVDRFPQTIREKRFPSFAGEETLYTKISLSRKTLDAMIPSAGE